MWLAVGEGEGEGSVLGLKGMGGAGSWVGEEREVGPWEGREGDHWKGLEVGV